MIEFKLMEKNGIRYEYSTIEGMVDFLVLENNFEIELHFEEDENLGYYESGIPIYGLRNTSLKLFKDFLVQNTKDLIFTYCQGFEVNQEYPRTLLANAGSYVLSKASFSEISQSWAVNNPYYHGYQEDIERLLNEWSSLFDKWLLKFSLHNNLFSLDGFNLKRAKKDKTLLKLYRSGNMPLGRKPKNKEGLTSTHYLALFYLAFRELEKKSNRKKIKKKDFLQIFTPVFEMLAEFKNEQWPYSKPRTIDENCLKKGGKDSKHVLSYSSSTVKKPFELLTPRLQQLLKSIERHDFILPDNWQDRLFSD